MKVAIALLTTSILFLGITMSMFGTSNTTSAELDKEIRWEQTHQVIMPRQ